MLNASIRRMNWNISGYFTGQRSDYNFPGQIIDPGYALINLAAILQRRARLQLLRPHRRISPTSNIRKRTAIPRSGASFASA